MKTKKVGSIFYITYYPKIDGVPITAGVEVDVVSADDEVPEWKSPELIGGELKYLYTADKVGYFKPRARVSDNPELEILDGEVFQVIP